MAKYSATIAVIFFLFTLSAARLQIIKSQNKDDDDDVTTEVIRLTAADVFNNHPVEPDSLIVQSVPLDLATARFRPINRLFYTRTRYPLLRHCRQHYRNEFFKERHVPYDTDHDVIGENSKFEEPPTFHGARARRWMRVHHLDRRQKDEEDDEKNGVSRILLKRNNFNKFKVEKKHSRHDNEKAEEEDDHQQKKKRKGGFIKGIRKFLDHLLD